MVYSGFACVYDVLMRDVDYKAWANYIDDLCAKRGFSGCRVADCACGTAELTLLLKERGYDIMGMDISEDMLREAMCKSRDAGLIVPFVHMDMRSFRLHRPVDVVIATCDGVNYLTSTDDLRRFFRAAHSALTSGGLLMFDVSTRHKLQNVLGNNVFAEDCGDVAYIWKNAYDPQSKLISMELTLFMKRESGYERAFEEHLQRAHSVTELTNALEASGFGDICVYGAFTENAPNDSSERVQVVAKRI